MKKIKSGLIMVCFLCFFFSGRVSANNWYDKILNSSGGSYTVINYPSNKKMTVRRNHFTKYSTRDINGDGVKELFLESDYNDVMVFTYYKKKIRPVAYFGNCRFFYYKNNTITYGYGSSTSVNYVTFRLKSGKLKKVTDYFLTTSSSVPEMYKKNGKKCTKAAFNKIYKKYCLKAKDFTFSPIFTLSQRKAMKLISGKKWYAHSSLYSDYYIKFTSTEVREYYKKNNKLHNKWNIYSITKSGNRYCITCFADTGSFQYRFDKSSNVEDIYYYFYWGDWTYSGSSSLSRYR